jgi:SAM-dependent methyltransferase
MAPAVPSAAALELARVRAYLMFARQLGSVPGNVALLESVAAATPLTRPSVSESGAPPCHRICSGDGVHRGGMMPRVFSYGALLRDEVQMATFGRLLRGQPDLLPSYELTRIPILDPEMAVAAELAAHANVTFNGDRASQVTGIVFDITDAELEAVEGYEADAGYQRREVTLASGTTACAYLDPSQGWSGIGWFTSGRSAIGLATVRQWAQQLPVDGVVLDLGCGSGIPLTKGLADAGFRVFGVDASAQLAEACRRNVPGVEVACEPAESSHFFDRRFDGIIAVGLIFLLPERTQRVIIHKVADALEPGGRFLLSAPREVFTWADSLTGVESRSLGAATYLSTAADAGLTLAGEYRDEGENDYYDFRRDTSTWV